MVDWMQRIAMDGNRQQSIVTSPEMTINEAVDAMERHHARSVLVGHGTTPLGFLSEEEIVAKVLALGLDPSVVHVEDVMLPGRLDRQGAFLIEEEPFLAGPLWAAETLHSRDDDDDEVLHEVLSGKCEECGLFSEELSDHEGLLMCVDCSGFRGALFS